MAGADTSGEEKWASLIRKLSCQLLETDFKWSCFVAAVQSFRHDSVVRPFPPDFIDRNSLEKRFGDLLAAVNSVSDFKRLRSESRRTLTVEALNLLDWVLDEKSFILRQVKRSTFNDIKRLTNQVVAAPVPQIVFEVKYSSSKEAVWREMVESMGNKVIHAYHGTKLENMHSILNTGLQVHLNKTSVYGKGIYLSEELSVSLAWSPLGRGWARSEISDKLGCVLVCEVIDHQDVKCQVSDRGRAHATDSLSGEVPEKYYVVENNQLVRVKYVLVYAGRRRSQVRVQREEEPRWWQEHRSFLIIIAYVLLLLTLGFANSNKASMWYHRYFHAH